MRIRWTMAAVDDLEAVKNYLDIHHPQFSRSTIRKLYDGVRSLKSMPERGRIGLAPGTREIVFHPLPYIVSYRVKGQAVEILRIYHGAQNRTDH
jgi:toxin ParE1/3/4